MSYIVLARRFRPQNFDEVVGQAHVTRTLSNAIESGRVAHAYLFSGARGVGKTSVARILAKSLNCQEGPTPKPCGVCRSCTETTSGSGLDVVEIDGASNNSVDDVRSLREQVKYMPTAGRYRIFIIDEVHMLSTSAFNALLKTLEEPPGHVIFIFATTEPHKIPATILSRCQQFEFRRIPTPQIIERLSDICSREEIEADPEALGLIARQATGSMRDSQSLLDRFISTGEKKITPELVVELLGLVGRQTITGLAGAITARDPSRALQIVADLFNSGGDVNHFCQSFLEHWRNVAVARTTKDPSGFIDASTDELNEIKNQARTLAPAEADWLFQTFASAAENIIRSESQRLLLEMTILKMAARPDLLDISELIKRFDYLEKKLSGFSGTGGGPRSGGSGGGSGGAGGGFGGGRPTHRSPAPISGGSRFAAPQNQPGPPAAPGPRAEAALQMKDAMPPIPPRSQPVDIFADWKDMVRFISGRNGMTGGHLHHAYPISLAESQLKLAIVGAFAQRYLSENEKRAELEREASLYIGEQISIEIVAHSDDLRTMQTIFEEQEKKRGVEKERIDSVRKEAREHPAVRMVIDQFPGASVNDIVLLAPKPPEAIKPPIDIDPDEVDEPDIDPADDQEETTD